MRRYPDGTLIYDPRDLVLVQGGAGRAWGRVVQLLDRQDGYQCYRVRFRNGHYRISEAQIIKQADTGTYGFVKHLEAPTSIEDYTLPPLPNEPRRFRLMRILQDGS